jgi:hypothetical protein
LEAPDGGGKSGENNAFGIGLTGKSGSDIDESLDMD